MNLFYDNVMVGRRQDGSPIYAKDLRDELACLRADSAELARVREPVKACTHEFSDNGEFELHCHLCDFHIDATPSRELMDEASQMAFEAGGDNDGGYILTGDEFDQIIAHVVSQAIVEREVAFSAKAAPEGFVLVPVEVKRDADRWQAFINCARIKFFGWAGYTNPDPNGNDPKNYRHFGGEFWTVHDAPTTDKKKAREILNGFADAAIAAAPKGDSHE